MGSLYDRHRERVRSVDKLIGKWDGTGQGQAKGRGKDIGSFERVPSTGGKSNRHDAFFELMATSIVPELMYFYIPLRLVFL
jgi:hypothetical protein